MVFESAEDVALAFAASGWDVALSWDVVGCEFASLEVVESAWG